MGNFMNRSTNHRKNSISLGLLVLSASLAMTIGCQQDPFAEKSEEIRNGIPPELQKVPTPEKPRDKDALHIDSLDFYTFKESVSSEISFSGRVLEPGAKFELSIDNMAKFPGATFDPVKGAFKWTPPRDTTGTEYGVERRLIIRLTSPATTPTGTTEGTTKAVLIYVTRAEVDPEIVSVDDMMKVPTREGELRKFNVVVKDPDAADADGSRPRLVSVPAKKGIQDVSGLVYMQEVVAPELNPQIDPVTKNWTFKMILDLRVQADQRGRDFTRNQETFKFGLQTISRYGRVGMKDVDASILTDVMKPDVSWFDVIDAVAGQENVIQFTVFDPYAEGKLNVNFITRVDQLPGSAVSSCKTASREGNVLCRISWKPLATTKGDFPIEFEAMNQSKVATDTKFIKEVFKRMIRVIPGSVVAPPAPAVPVTPGPVTTPTTGGSR